MASFFEPGHEESWYLKGFEFIIDVCFFIDLVVMFFTSYRDDRGAEIWDSKKIAYNYVVSKRFLSDFGSLIG